jgi:hypothetical protein
MNKKLFDRGHSYLPQRKFMIRDSKKKPSAVTNLKVKVTNGHQTLKKQKQNVNKKFDNQPNNHRLTVLTANYVNKG